MLNVEVDVNDEIKSKLREAARLGLNLTLPFTMFAKSWFQSNKSIFALKGPGQYPDYGGFNPNEILYGTTTRRMAAKKRKQREVGFVYPMMKRTGLLEDSLTNPSHNQAINLIVNKNALYLGTRVKYAPFHQSPAARTKMPFRPVVFLGVEQVAPTEHRNNTTRMINYLDRHIQDSLTKLSSPGVT